MEQKLSIHYRNLNYVNGKGTQCACEIILLYVKKIIKSLYSSFATLL